MEHADAIGISSQVRISAQNLSNLFFQIKGKKYRVDDGGSPQHENCESEKRDHNQANTD